MSSNRKQQRWGVIGGGVLGMTIAHRLRQDGDSVTLFEATDHLGGLADSWQLNDVTWDRHYHVTLLSDRYWLQILSELGLKKDMRWVETKTGFYSNHRLHSMSNTWEFLRFPPLNLLEKFRLGLTIFCASKRKDWRSLERIPVADWLTKWSGRGAFEKVWLPLLRSKLGDNYRRTSAAFIWATIARMYAARRSGLKKEMFGYVRGGYARIQQCYHQALLESGVDIKLGTAVKEVSAADSQSLGVVTANGEREFFDQVVVTLPSRFIGRVCPAFRKTRRFGTRGCNTRVLSVHPPCWRNHWLISM